MLNNKAKMILIGLTTLLLLIAAVFYNTATAQPANAEDILKMTRAWKDRKLEGGQWVHFVYAVTLHETNGVLLPNGQPMPLSYIHDEWYYLNNAGLVEKGVFTVKDQDGTILQQSAYQNNIIINFTYEDRQEGQQPYLLNIDLGFENKVREARNNELPIKDSSGSINGKPSLEYSFVENLKLPTQLGNEQVIVDSIKIQGSFDEDTGDFVQIQTIWILNNGEEVIYETAQIISVESFPGTTDEILNILEMVE